MSMVLTLLGGNPCWPFIASLEPIEARRLVFHKQCLKNPGRFQRNLHVRATIA